MIAFNQQIIQVSSREVRRYSRSSSVRLICVCPVTSCFLVLEKGLCDEDVVVVVLMYGSVVEGINNTREILHY